MTEQRIDEINLEVAQRLLQMARMVQDKPFILTKIKEACLIMKEVSEQLRPME